MTYLCTSWKLFYLKYQDVLAYLSPDCNILNIMLFALLIAIVIHFIAMIVLYSICDGTCHKKSHLSCCYVSLSFICLCNGCFVQLSFINCSFFSFSFVLVLLYWDFLEQLTLNSNSGYVLNFSHSKNLHM